jgi:hypothetical protein
MSSLSIAENRRSLITTVLERFSLYTPHFVKHDLKESIEVFMGRNLDPLHRRDRQGERRLALPHRRHRPAKLPLTDVTDRVNNAHRHYRQGAIIHHRRHRQPKYHLTEVTDTLKDSLFKNLIYRRNDELPAANYSHKP